MRVSIDLLTGQHELIPFDLGREEDWQWLEVERAGKTLRVRVPRVYDAGVERILRVDGGGDRLYLTGEVGHDYGDRGRIGCLLVARPESDGTWVTILFHGLYPFSMSGLA